MEGFTEREVEVASLVAEGLSNEEICAQLGVSPNTVRYHLKELYARIGKSSRTKLTREFLGGGIVVAVRRK